ncbi:MAG: aspartate dehydrogenase [Jannaschia sp.]
MNLVLIGFGAINSRVAALLAERRPDIRIVAVALHRKKATDRALPHGAEAIFDSANLARFAPDLVVEAAGRAAIETWAEAALDCCRTLICASTSAFCDDAFRIRLEALADARGGQIVLTPGAVGAMDAVGAAAILPVEDVLHVIRKPPQAWRGTAASDVTDLDAVTEEIVIFEGSARDAAARYPQNANAAATTALAGIGLDRTRTRLIVDPEATRNCHEIALRGAAGSFRIVLENAPTAGNPKSSELTALSLVRLIENRAASLSI